MHVEVGHNVGVSYYLLHVADCITLLKVPTYNLDRDNDGNQQAKEIDYYALQLAIMWTLQLIKLCCPIQEG